MKRVKSNMSIVGSKSNNTTLLYTTVITNVINQLNILLDVVYHIKFWITYLDICFCILSLCKNLHKCET